MSPPKSVHSMSVLTELVIHNRRIDSKSLIYSIKHLRYVINRMDEGHDEAALRFLKHVSIYQEKVIPSFQYVLPNLIRLLWSQRLPHRTSNIVDLINTYLIKQELVKGFEQIIHSFSKPKLQNCSNLNLFEEVCVSCKSFWIFFCDNVNANLKKYKKAKNKASFVSFLFL